MVFESTVFRALVLENNIAEDVSRAMIESGRQKEPFYVFEMDLAYERIQHFKKIMPRIKIFYAMKANDSDMMIKLVASLGLGFDCASPGEIHKILKINVSPLSIIFATPTKTPEWMSYARQCGIKLTTFDTLYELQKIKKNWPEANLLIRIRVDGDSKYNLGEKFGCDFETQAIPLLEEAAVLGVKVVGVAYHVGSACFSADGYVLGLQRAKTLFEYEAKAGREMNIVDIGGGFMSDRTDRIDEGSRGLRNEKLEHTILWGPSCDSLDRVMKNVDIMLPRCTPSDWLVFSNQGAYTLTFTSIFSCLEGPLIRSVISEELWKKIKDSKAFEINDFIKQDISEPLSSRLPPVIVQTVTIKSVLF